MDLFHNQYVLLTESHFINGMCTVFLTLKVHVIETVSTYLLLFYPPFSILPLDLTEICNGTKSTFSYFLHQILELSKTFSFLFFFWNLFCPFVTKIVILGSKNQIKFSLNVLYILSDLCLKCFICI